MTNWLRLEQHALDWVGAQHFKLTINVNNLPNNCYNAFEYLSAAGLYGAGGNTNPATIDAGSLLALPAPRRVFCHG
ncbi:MAG TPA: hypothetical protein VMV25_13390 [Steroidobacteraceae bacterium]|nr:hypothetical protein [Steroidobacteraceae bacterium]